MKTYKEFINEDSPFSKVGKYVMKKKLSRGIKRDDKQSHKDIDKMVDHDFFDRKNRKGPEERLSATLKSRNRKEKALRRLNRESVAEGWGAAYKKMRGFK